MSVQLLQAWLDRVCGMLPGARSAALVRVNEQAAVCTWPSGEAASAALIAAAGLAIAQGSEVSTADRGEGEGAVVAHPLLVDGRPFGAVALVLPADSAQLAVVHRLLAWSQAWLELLLQQRTGAGAAVDSSEAAHMLAALPVADDMDAFGLALVTQLAERFGAQRVWLGWMSSAVPAVVAVSHQARLDARSSLVGMVQEAMVECAAEVAPISLTGASEDPARAAHGVLLRESAAGMVLSIPLAADGAADGVVLLEFPGGGEPDASELTLIQQVLAQALPLLQLQARIRPGPLARLERGVQRLAVDLVRRGWTKSRALLVLLALVLAILVLGQGRNELRADAFLEGRVQQAIAAPFDGYIETAEARAGQAVVQGQVIATMNDEDIRLELQRVEGELAALSREYRQALARVDQAETRIVQARMAQAEARRTQLGNRLDMVELKAPVAGLVISGDLSRAIGTPVSKGDLLFEIAPLDGFRIVALVREIDVDEVLEGQPGTLVLSSYPGMRIPFTVDRISSVLDDGDGEGVVFRVEGSLAGDYEMLRPGMEGVARIDAGARSLWWIYTHEIVDWFRLLAWRWLP